MRPDDLTALLQCPLCHSRLKDPTTIRCGHTLCGGHVNSVTSRCPIASCSRDDSSSSQNISSSSRVLIRHSQQPPPQLPGFNRRPDVVVNKLLALCQAADVAVTPSSDADDDDDERPSSSSPRPRKRRRRYSRTPSPPPAAPPLQSPTFDDFDDSTDLLSHLRHTSNVQRETHPDQPIPGPSSPPPHSLFTKNLNRELCCEICLQLFYQPLTTPCQHTFCAKCIHRSLDHSPNCPLCRQNLPEYHYFQEHPHNKLITTILLKAFPEKYAARAETINAEERDSRLDTPIFVCQLSFPGIPTVLHFFEPRYRLMLRRCLDSPNPCFGMVMPPRSGTGSSPSAANAGVTMEFGTMLEIRSVQMLSDGRSMVETWGTHRFRIMEKGVLDGYVVGRVERVDDYDSDFDDDEEDEVEEAVLDDVQPHGAAKSPLPLVRQTSSTSSTTSTTSSSSGNTSNNSFLSRIASTLSTPRSSPTSPPTVYKSPFGPSIPELMEACKSFLGELQQGTAPWVVQRMNDAYGPPPTDPSSFSFWVALVLPIEETEKAKLLPIRSIRLRLRVVVGWIEQLRVTWWFTSGCTVL